MPCRSIRGMVRHPGVGPRDHFSRKMTNPNAWRSRIPAIARKNFGSTGMLVCLIWTVGHDSLFRIRLDRNDDDRATIFRSRFGATWSRSSSPIAEETPFHLSQPSDEKASAVDKRSREQGFLLGFACPPRLQAPRRYAKRQSSSHFGREKGNRFSETKNPTGHSSQGAAGARRKRNKCRRPSEASYAGFILAPASTWGNPPFYPGGGPRPHGKSPCCSQRS